MGQGCSRGLFGRYIEYSGIGGFYDASSLSPPYFAPGCSARLHWGCCRKSATVMCMSGLTISNPPNEHNLTMRCRRNEVCASSPPGCAEVTQQDLEGEAAIRALSSGLVIIPSLSSATSGYFCPISMHCRPTVPMEVQKESTP